MHVKPAVTGHAAAPGAVREVGHRTQSVEQSSNHMLIANWHHPVWVASQ